MNKSIKHYVLTIAAGIFIGAAITYSIMIERENKHQELEHYLENAVCVGVDNDG